jgi:hypothetical protein
MRYYFITFHGRLLSRSGAAEALSQLQWSDLADRDCLASVDLDPELVRPNYVNFIADTPGVTFEADIRHFGRRTVHVDPKKKTVSLAQDGRYLSAQPDGTIHYDRPAAAGWESLLLCSDDDLDFLADVKSRRWIVKSTRELVSGERISLGWKHSLSVGGLKIALPYNLPFDCRQYPFRLTVLVDGWRIEELVQFHPLIYSVAVGAEHVLAQLFLSLRSLAQIGRYDGDVLVFTDRSHAQICAAVPWLAPERISVVPIPAAEWVGYVAGKYCIVEHQPAYRYQPVVYMDPDIIYNTDAKSFLIEMAVSDRLSAPMEESATLEQSPSVGASLLQLDNANPRFACGFNGGTIGIPNLPMHRHTLELIRRVIENLLAVRGRRALNWVDQEVANYVSYKIAHFDMNHISRCVRYGGEQTARSLGPLTGLVHFWMAARGQRHRAMSDYLGLLLDHAGLERT